MTLMTRVKFWLKRRKHPELGWFRADALETLGVATRLVWQTGATNLRPCHVLMALLSTPAGVQTLTACGMDPVQATKQLGVFLRAGNDTVADEFMKSLIRRCLDRAQAEVVVEVTNYTLLGAVLFDIEDPEVASFCHSQNWPMAKIKARLQEAP